MTPTLPTPTEELEIRQHSEEAWQLTWANAADLTPLTPRQAFIEGHYLAFWCGIMACRTTRKAAQLQVDRLETQLSLALTALVVAIVWGVMR